MKLEGLNTYRPQVPNNDLATSLQTQPSADLAVTPQPQVPNNDLATSLQTQPSADLAVTPQVLEIQTGLGWLDEKIKNNSVSVMDMMAYQELTGVNLFKVIDDERKYWRHQARLDQERADKFAIEQAKLAQDRRNKLDDMESKTKQKGLETALTNMDEAQQLARQTMALDDYVDSGGYLNMMKRALHKISFKGVPLDEINSGRVKGEQTFMNADAQLNRAIGNRGQTAGEIKDNEAKNSLLASDKLGILRQIYLTKKKALGNLKAAQDRLMNTHGRQLTQKQAQFIANFEADLKNTEKLIQDEYFRRKG